MLGVVTLVFFLVHMIPGDPVELMLGETASRADLERLRSDLGLDRPVLEQYGHFLRGLSVGDLGTSFFYRRPVRQVILEKLPATVELALAAMALALLIALPLGVIAAVRKDSLVDRSAMLASLAGISMPNFWLGPLLIIRFPPYYRRFY